MGVSSWKGRVCRANTCCFCFPNSATTSYWVATVGLVWGSLATLVDFISAFLPRQACINCLDYDLNSKLCLAGGAVNTLQFLASALLLIGVKKKVWVLVVVWLCCSVVGLVMQGVWLVVTLPYTPSLRGLVALLHLGWGLHYCIIVRTWYTKMRHPDAHMEDTLEYPVPPNSPVRRHKRHKRRVDKSTQPPVRTLLGAAFFLQQARQEGEGEQGGNG